MNDAPATPRRVAPARRIARAAAVVTSLCLASAALGGEPAPLKEHSGAPRVESLGDTTAVRPTQDGAGDPHPAARDSTLARAIRRAPRVRLLLDDALRYEGGRAFSDSAGIAFKDAKLAGLRFAWGDIATLEVSGGDRRWLGAAAGGAAAFVISVLLVGPTLDEEGMLTGTSLDGLRAVTYGVSVGLGAFIGYEIGRSTRRWEHAYP